MVPQFSLTPSAVGLTFMYMGLFQLVSPLWGVLLDRIENGEGVTLFGVLVSILGLALIGPLPFLNTQA
jgi:nitrate/nitrite transporter NarK